MHRKLDFALEYNIRVECFFYFGHSPFIERAVPSEPLWENTTNACCSPRGCFLIGSEAKGDSSPRLLHLLTSKVNMRDGRPISSFKGFTWEPHSLTRVWESSLSCFTSNNSCVHYELIVSLKLFCQAKPNFLNLLKLSNGFHSSQSSAQM